MLLLLLLLFGFRDLTFFGYNGFPIVFGDTSEGRGMVAFDFFGDNDEAQCR